MTCLLISFYLLFLIEPRGRANNCLCRSVLSRTQKAWSMVMGFESRQVSHIYVSRGSHLSDQPIAPKGLGRVIVKGLSPTYYLTLINNARILQLKTYNPCSQAVVLVVLSSRPAVNCQARHRPRSFYLYTAPKSRRILSAEHHVFT